MIFAAISQMGTEQDARMSTQISTQFKEHIAVRNTVVNAVGGAVRNAKCTYISTKVLIAERVGRDYVNGVLTI